MDKNKIDIVINKNYYPLATGEYIIRMLAPWLTTILLALLKSNFYMLLFLSIIDIVLTAITINIIFYNNSSAKTQNMICGLDFMQCSITLVILSYKLLTFPDKTNNFLLLFILFLLLFIFITVYLFILNLQQTKRAAIIAEIIKKVPLAFGQELVPWLVLLYVEHY